MPGVGLLDMPEFSRARAEGRGVALEWRARQLMPMEQTSIDGGAPYVLGDAI